MFTKKKQLRVGCVVVVVGLKVSLLLYAAIASRERRMDYNNRLVMQIEIESAFFLRASAAVASTSERARERERKICAIADAIDCQCL